MLRDEGSDYAEQLAADGVAVDELFYDDVFHTFLNFPEMARADAAHDDIATALQSNFE